MALATRRSYAGAAPACTLSSDIAAGATSFSITGTTTNWPATATGPFYMVIDPGLSTEEKVLVAGRTGGSLSSVTRGVDGTTAASHVTGATCYPVFTAVDANDANLLASRLSAKGDLISSDGSDPTRVAVGSNNTRLVADSAQTSGIKWVADTQNTVIDAKGDLLVGSAADTVARLAVGTNNQVLVAASGETTGLKWAEAGYRYVTTVTFTSSGSFTKASYSYLRAIRVRLCGGGGGGAGAPAATANNYSLGRAGGGGGYAESFITDISGLASSVTVTIGAGGTAGAAGFNSGGNGGTTSFGSTVSASGGTGGVAGVNNGAYPSSGIGFFLATPSGGGQSQTGDITQVGGNAGPDVFGAALGYVVTSPSGSSVFGPGNAGVSTQTQAAGSAGNNKGVGGSGGGSVNGGTAVAGGAGGAGVCYVDLFA